MHQSGPGSVSRYSDLDLSRFQRDGYIVLEQVVPDELCTALHTLTLQHLDPLVAPAEFEADVGYPGAPRHRETEGGQTPRRLLHAFARDPLFARLVNNDTAVAVLEGLLGPHFRLSQCHHNCVMTKFPGFSSATLWHQDIRYWSFDRPELITAWYALGEETRKNGALRVIPGSHLLALDRGRLDADLFLRPELADNKALIRQAVDVELKAGDVLLFHCKLFHAAGKNRTDQTKLSPVFTFHAADNHPIPNTRSDQWPSIVMPCA